MRAGKAMVVGAPLMLAILAAIPLADCRRGEPKTPLTEVAKDAKDWSEADVLYDAYAERIDDPHRLYEITEICYNDWRSEVDTIPFSDALWMACVYRLADLKTPEAINTLLSMGESGHYDAHMSETIMDALTIIGQPAIPYIEKSKYPHKDELVELIREGERVF